MGTVNITEAWLKRVELPDGAARARFFDQRLPGYGVVIGERFVTFIARGRVKRVNKGTGKLETVRCDATIGRWGRPGAGDDHGKTWTEDRARKEAMRVLGQMSRHVDPIVEKASPSGGGPTLRQGLELHIANMRKGGGKGRFSNGQSMPCSERSIMNVETEVKMHLKTWLDRPLIDLNANELTKAIAKIQAATKPREGSVNTPGAALVKRLVRHVGAIWESTDELHDLPVKNPARKVTTQSVAPREQRLEPGEFADWHTRVMAMTNRVRRDFNLLALYTAVRSEGLRYMVWEDVDFKEHVLHVRRAKGNRPYTIPMTKTVEAILKRRRDDNAMTFEAYGGDHGFVLPTVTRAKPFRVIAMQEPKEFDTDKKTGERTKAIVGPHVLRKTWNSVAIEERIPPEDREALMNHEGRGVNVRHYGFPRNWDALRDSARKVETGLLARIEIRG